MRLTRKVEAKNYLLRVMADMIHSKTTLTVPSTYLFFRQS